ncbi:MAG: DOMON domain-containing protein [Promethearchaeota archaeon]
MTRKMSTIDLYLINAYRRALFFLFLIILLFINISYETTPILAQNTEDNVLDGLISDNEYQNNASFSDEIFQLFWTIINDEIYLGLVGKTKGWVTLGIDPEVRMKGADMLFGMVANNGQVFTQDAYSRVEIGSDHPPDTELGGTNDILEYNGTESSDTTTIELKRYLTTGDEYDKDIPANGTLKIIWAIGGEDDFETVHVQRDNGLLNITTGKLAETDELVPVEHYLILAISLFSGLFTLLVIVDSIGRKSQKETKEKREDGGIA